VLVHALRGYDHLAEYERADDDVEPAPEDERKAGEGVRREQQARADRSPPGAGQRERGQAGGRLERTTAMPTAIATADRSRARSSISPPTVSSSNVPPAVQNTLTAAEPKARADVRGPANVGVCRGAADPPTSAQVSPVRSPARSARRRSPGRSRHREGGRIGDVSGAGQTLVVYHAKPASPTEHALVPLSSMAADERAGDSGSAAAFA
jgi:hypothetical protein